MRTALLCVIVA